MAFSKHLWQTVRNGLKTRETDHQERLLEKSWQHKLSCSRKEKKNGAYGKVPQSYSARAMAMPTITPLYEATVISENGNIGTLGHR